MRLTQCGQAECPPHQATKGTAKVGQAFSLPGRGLLATLLTAVSCLAQATAPAPVPYVKDLKFPPLGPVQIPKVETYTLANGMKVYLLEDHELPLVNGTARVRTGNLFDPADKVGLAGLTGTVMRTGGTRALTGDQIDERLENVAASVESQIGETAGTVSFSSMKETAGDVMEVFRGVLMEPEFRQDKVDLAKNQIHGGIARRNDEPRSIAEREFARLVYGPDTPYGWQVEHAMINRIQRADLVAFHQRYFFPANTLLTVWGDFQPAEMKQRIEGLFGGWKARQEAVPAFPKVTAGPRPGAFLAAKQDVTQTFFAVGHLGGVLSDADYPALEVMADILGGGFRSRLFQRVRTRMGAAYEIGAGWGANYGHPGLFEVSGSTKSLSTVDTLKAVREELDRIRTAEVSAEELETAKQATLNSLVFAFDSRAKTLSRVLTYEYFGYPRDFLDRYQKALAGVTRADVLRAAQKHLRPENLTLVAVGNPPDFGTGLSALGVEVMPVDLSIPEVEPTAASSAGSIEAGQQLLARAQQAVGGAARLYAVKDLRQVTLLEIDARAGGLRARQTDRWIAPALFRQDSVLPMGAISAWWDGRTGWLVTPQDAGPLAGLQLRQVQGDLFRNYVRMLRADRLGYTVNAVAADTLELSDGNGNVARLRMDPATGLPAAVTYRSVQLAGEPSLVEETYSDFHEVSGLKVPFLINILQSGRQYAKVTVEEYSLNSGLKPEDLSARPK